MKIVHIETSYTGMGNAVYRLHQFLLESGYDSVLLNETSVIVNENIKVVNPRNSISECINRKFCGLSLLGKKRNSYYYSPDAFLKCGIVSNRDVLDADVIFLHWTHGLFLSLNDIEDICKLGKPVVFFLHDKWYMTGGCNHNFDCLNYLKNCAHCPMFSVTKISPVMQFLRKKHLYSKYDNLVFVNFSTWMDVCLTQTNICYGRRHVVIPPIIDNQVFFPVSKDEARKKLGLPLDKKYISFGCVSSLSNIYKGFPYLELALSWLKDRGDVHLLLFGAEQSINWGIPCTSYGIVKDDSFMRLINSASDVFIAPSLVESYGMAVMENLLCGTPVVAFNTSSLPELIIHFKNGYLSNNKDARDLYEGINYVLDNIDERSFVKPDYETALVKDKYIDFINSLK